MISRLFTFFNMMIELKVSKRMKKRMTLDPMIPEIPPHLYQPDHLLKLVFIIFESYFK
jgi:hypothetical protein